MKLFALMEENATLYEWGQRFVSLNYRAFLRELRREDFFQPALSYLDLGCGTGFLRDYLRGEDYLGVDLNARYIAAACRKRGNCFRVGDALTVGQLPRQFDRVICIGLLHHLDDAQARTALAQCRSCLKSGGEVFVLDALWPRRKWSLGAALRRSDNGAFVRTLPEWERLFASELAVRVLRTAAQWPLDYVFLRGAAPPRPGGPA
jgi:SAM-dependent methyltransferase